MELRSEQFELRVQAMSNMAAAALKQKQTVHSSDHSVLRLHRILKLANGRCSPRSLA
jgi:hypothetical protein